MRLTVATTSPSVRAAGALVALALAACSGGGGSAGPGGGALCDPAHLSSADRELLEAAQRVCAGARGDNVPRAASYTGDGPFAVLALDGTGMCRDGLTHTFLANRHPLSVADLALVACIDDEVESPNLCSYTNGDTITQVNYSRRVVLKAARTGVTVDEDMLDGVPTGPCPQTTTRSYTQPGRRVGQAEVEAWLRPFVETRPFRGSIDPIGDEVLGVSLFDLSDGTETGILGGRGAPIAFVPGTSLVLVAGAGYIGGGIAGALAFHDASTFVEQAALRRTMRVDPRPMVFAQRGPLAGLRYFVDRGGTVTALRLDDPTSQMAFVKDTLWTASPDGAWVVVTSGGTGEIVVHSLDEGGAGKEVARLMSARNPTSRVTALAISSQGVLAVGRDPGSAGSGADELVELWDLPTGQELATEIGGLERLSHVAFTPDGRGLTVAARDPGAPATGPQPRLVTLWALAPDGAALAATKVRTYPYAVYGDSSSAIVLSPDGRLLAAQELSGSRIGDILVWSVEDGALLHRLYPIEGTPAGAFAFSADGSMLAATVSFQGL